MEWRSVLPALVGTKQEAGLHASQGDLQDSWARGPKPATLVRTDLDVNQDRVRDTLKIEKLDLIPEGHRGHNPVQLLGLRHVPHPVQ